MVDVDEKNKGGRPTDYRPQYCDMLIEHMKGGNSLESFGSVVHCDASTLFAWLRTYPEFSKARKVGKAYLAKYYEEMGKAIAVGNARRLVSEEPIVENGKVVMMPNGKPAMRQVYAPSSTSATAWIYLTKNMLGWRDRRELLPDELPDDGPKPLPEGMSLSEIQSRALQLLEKAKNEQRRERELNQLPPATGADRAGAIVESPGSEDSG